ncbi:MAG: AraC family transcriptional regulator [Pseudomonadota bacterium]
MPTFPIPVFVSCVLGFAALRLWQRNGHTHPLVFLLMLCAAQSLIIALNQHYEVAMMRTVQPLVASLIPPLAWFAYRGTTGLAGLVHAVGPLAVLAALLVAPLFIDVILPMLFVIYGSMIVLSAKDGPDQQPDTLLASGDLPARIWLVIGAALIASALSDVLIIAAHLGDFGDLKPWIISLFSVGNLLVIGALSVSVHLETSTDSDEKDAARSSIADPDLWSRLQLLMQNQRPYLDPDLTLTRLARKLQVPTKLLSATINQTTGENVSRFINNARIAHAQRTIREGESVTNAMLNSGFNTKSNFNREFLRVAGSSPSAWMAQTEVEK